MPVLREHDVLEALRQLLTSGTTSSPSAPQAPARAEIVLHVDDDEGILRAQRQFGAFSHSARDCALDSTKQS